MTLTPSTADLAAPDDPASTLPTGESRPRMSRRIIAMTVWLGAFVGMMFVLGLPTDPVYAFVWLWTATIAWHIDRPWPSHLGFVRDWAAVVLLLVAYNISRGLADKAIAPHVTPMIFADEHMFGWFTGGKIPTVWLQLHLFRTHVQWYDVVVSFVYFSHFVTALIVAVVLWMTSRQRWVLFIRRFITLNVLGLATYFLYPAAPPWWASDHGYIQPTYEGLDTRGWSAIGLHGAGNLLNAAKIDAANPVAAMPSLHSAYALIVVAFFLPTVRKRWWPLLLAYPLAMTFTLVYSGEHYVTDVLFGWLYVLITLVGVSAAEKGWAAWRARRVAAGERAAPTSPAPAPVPVAAGNVLPASAPIALTPTIGTPVIAGAVHGTPAGAGPLNGAQINVQPINVVQVNGAQVNGAQINDGSLNVPPIADTPAVLGAADNGSSVAAPEIGAAPEIVAAAGFVVDTTVASPNGVGNHTNGASPPAIPDSWSDEDDEAAEIAASAVVSSPLAAEGHAD